MRGNHKKSNNESRQEMNSDNDDDIEEIKNSVFSPFVNSNIEIRQTKINNPMKIQCPFQNRSYVDWKQMIDDYFNSLSLYDHPKFSPNFYHRMLSLSENPNRDEISDYVIDKINILTNQAVNELLSQTILKLFYEKLKKIQTSLQNLHIIFSQLCGNVSKLIISNFKSHFGHENIRKFRDFIQRIITEFSRDENSEIVLLIIQFFTQYDLLTKEVKDHFSSTFINTMNSIAKKNKKSPFENTAKLFCKLCQIFPLDETSILERIIKPYLKNVLKMDLQSFITSIIPNILDYFEDIYNFVYSTSDPNSIINCFVDYYNNNTKKLNFDDVLNIFRIFKNFSTEIKIKIAQSIRKCLPKNDESIAIKYADIIDNTFRQEIDNKYNGANYDMLDEMYLIQNREAFENTHFSRMLRRSLEVSMVPDQNFIENYKLHFGEYSVTRFESLLNDYKESTKLADEFKSMNEIPSFLNIFIFYSCNWGRKYRVLSIIPDIVKNYLESFSKFYKAKRPRQLIEWSPLLSNCILEINRITVKCNGITASILYSLQNGPKTSDEISKEIFYDNNEVELILNTLKTNNYGNFISMKNNTYSINQKAKPEGNLVDLHLYLPQDIKTEEKKIKNLIMTSRGRQIEAAIILCLKGNSAIKESDLFDRTQQKLKFILNNFVFQEKLKTLALKRFIKRDLDECTVTYIP